MSMDLISDEIKQKHEVKPVEYMALMSASSSWWLLRDSNSVADPDPRSGVGKKSRSRSGMNITDHISGSLETIFRVKNTYIL
jgi:hypothetical protein